MDDIRVEYSGEIYICSPPSDMYWNWVVLNKDNSKCAMSASRRRSIIKKAKKKMKEYTLKSGDTIELKSGLCVTEDMRICVATSLRDKLNSWSAPPSPVWTTRSIACGEAKPAQEKTMPTFYGTDTDATQKNYLQSRINTLYWSKYSDLQRAFGLANDERPTTAKDLIDRITAGKYVLRDDSDYQEDFDYDFGGLFGIIWRDPSVKKDRDGFNKANDALEAAKQDAIDLIVISDAATGLKAVQDFATKTFH